MSNVLGLIIVVLSVRLVVGLPPGLPRCIGERRLPHRLLERMVNYDRLLRVWHFP